MSSQASTELYKLAVGMVGQIVLVEFDGKDFNIADRYTRDLSSPLHLLYKEPNLLYVADQLSLDTSVFKLSQTQTEMSHISSARGTLGGRSLTFNVDKTRLVELSCMDRAGIDIWDSSAADGSLSLIKTLDIPDSGDGYFQYHMYECVLDPTGRFFVVVYSGFEDYGGYRLLIIDSKDDRYEITDSIPLDDKLGVRRIAFFEDGARTFLVVFAHESQELILYEVKYSADSFSLTDMIQRLKTEPRTNRYGQKWDVTANDLVVAPNNRDLYTLNRAELADPAAITHYMFRRSKGDGNPELRMLEWSPGYGWGADAMCLSADGKYAFIGHHTNPDLANGFGLVAFRCLPTTGVLLPAPLAAIQFHDIAFENDFGARFGPEFICEI
ncbi:hypothetical protein F5Y04DRAFT_291803 [Hypomontagnella monticulosa]|nr:hypothetical protein F5Y04DRAFT_291803 [Hypomontagnella monticulosa]